jgi:hypothetical protein
MTRTTAQMRLNAHKREIAPDYPYQVALPDFMCCEENYKTIVNFCSVNNLQFKTMPVWTKWAKHKTVEYRLHCFRSRKDAETFANHFDGEHFNSKTDREGGKVDGAWIRLAEWKPIERCGPLEVPKFLRENP